MNEPADNRDDLTLCAYLDGELSDEEEANVAARLAAEPSLAARLAALRGADTDARRVYQAVDDQPLPQAVLDLLDAGEPARAPAEARVIPFPARVLRDFWQAPVAIAASVALATGFVVASLYDQRVPRGGPAETLLAGEVAPGSELYRLLESGISGSPMDFGGDRRGHVLLTFQDRAGEYCRQARLDDSSGSVQAVACRRNGTWRNEVWSFRQAPDASANYQQASSGVPPAVQAALSELLADQPPLGLTAEKQIVSRGWKKTAD